MTEPLSPPARRMPLTISTYRFVTRLGGGLFQRLVRKRMAKGKEDPTRCEERFGVSPLTRPEGHLTWIHAASVGESLAALPLIDALRETYPDKGILVTTGTTTSAELMARRLPQGAIHQYVPLDHPRYVIRFLQHWKPDLALWMESEFWPNLILETAKRQIPMGLLNARMSQSSFRRWHTAPTTSAYLLNCFQVISAIDDSTSTMLRDLGAPHAKAVGNLKYASPPLPYDADALKTLNAQSQGRPLWLAASTHPGEEEVVAKAHRLLQNTHSDCLTCIVPRHPERGPDIAATLMDQNFNIALRSRNEALTAETDIYIADTLGELGLFYRLADAAVIGGSFIAHGGQNPLEPARVDCPFVHGPYVFNFRDIYATMDHAGASAVVNDERDLAAAIAGLMSDKAQAKEQARQARTIAESADDVLTKVIQDIIPLFRKGAKDAHA